MPTPEPTPTPETKQYNICAPEQFQDCPISVEDLFNGNYWRWLNTLSKPFDPNFVKNVSLFNWEGFVIIYDLSTIPNFNVKGTEPFRRDVTSAFVQYTDLDGKPHEYAVMPVEYYDPKHTDKNQWVITVQAFFYPGHKYTKAEELQAISYWRKKMNITPIGMNSHIHMGEADPLVNMTFEKYPDMDKRFDDFVNGNFSALSAPGIVLLNDIVSYPWSPNQYK